MQSMKKKNYRQSLYDLQVELVKLQRHFIECQDKILILFEGRDAAGKDGIIKRITEHLSPRETRVVALGKPSDQERGGWYFQRYVTHLPVSGEFVLFNRSWYNRACVEMVMGFCTAEEYQEFMRTVVAFERMLTGAGIHLLKYYLDIDHDVQKARLSDRKRDPLKQWKISPVDEQALNFWDQYTEARDAMLAGSHSPEAPWRVVHANDKRSTRINVIRDILHQLTYCDKDTKLARPDLEIVWPYGTPGAKLAL